ncbi:HEAT repeat domain-containing protein [Dictyobacter kobayashii]|uniref:Uncharacterized protein n=1 Tax=Dictyobacter kobayashii TaxID=2014872 RepID=A0A402ARZ8_9CHLR|nr:hypothetical protein [Dictyobacter kobayashii]GCE21875.1 hypothetical protein KDK_56750 [Dictyobacter kobayashii]
MKRVANISGPGSKSRQRDWFLRGVSLVLFGFFLVLCVLAGGFYWLSTTSEGFSFGLLTHLAGLLATVVFLVWLALVTALHLRREKDFLDDRVVATLRATLKGPSKDPDVRVRVEAARGLAGLDVEESALHHRHEELDALLASTLSGKEMDPDPGVRVEAARGLAELELEEHSYQHEHHDLDDLIFKPDL